MKLICEYCDSYVEINDNAVCPCCHAPLGSAVVSERRRVQKENEAVLLRQEEMEKQRLEMQKRQQNMQLIGTIAGSVASGLIGYSTGSMARKLRGPGTGVLAALGGNLLKSIFGK